MDIFVEISLIIVLAAFTSGILRLFKQPLVLGYLITGFLVGPYAFNVLQTPEMLEVFSSFGITLLLFIVGLNLSPRVIKDIGRIALIAGLGQVTLATIFGFIVTLLLGFSVVESIYISIAIAFSGTIIVTKLLSDKEDLDHLYGKIAIGVLLVQDVVAAVVLIAISSTSLGVGVYETLYQLLWKVGLISALLFFAARYVLPHMAKFFAKSTEFLFLFAIAWGMGVASLFHVLGLSIEIGALIAGVILSLFPYHFEIGAKMQPLRDFFIIMFFILLGSQLSIDGFWELLVPAVTLSLFIFVGTPIIMLSILGYLGYSKRVGFMSGISLSQISVFSLIFVTLGWKVGHLSSQIVAIVTLVGIITITGSSYLVIYSDKIYPYLSRFLSIFERSKVKKEARTSRKYDVILFGYNRIGYDFLGVFRKIGAKYLIVDYDPEVTCNLIDAGINCKYGDADDGEFLDTLRLNKVKMIISTIPVYETNAFLIDKVRKVNKKAVIMAVSHHIEDTYRLYDIGATYVIMPHFLGGEYASTLLHKHKFNLEKFIKEQEKHIKNLNKRKILGHKHPKISKNG